MWSNKLSSLPVNAAGAAKDSAAVTADYESAEKKAGWARRRIVQQQRAEEEPEVNNRRKTSSTAGMFSHLIQ